MVQDWLSAWFRTGARSNVSSRPRGRWRLGVERLEDRLTPVSSVTDLTGGITPTQLVQSLLGPGVKVSNVTFKGDNVAAGKFSGGQNSIGFDQGILLSTGQAKSVIGTGSNFASTDNGDPGDSQLDAIVAPDPTFDATILEFDFVASGGTLNFQYVFGSEEYPEFVNASFNDVFAFYLNGKNIALIPNTSTPVSIDNVNAGANASFFVDNYTTGTLATALDGLTKVLTATATVTPGQTNHIKLAIADAGDHILDSDVFIQAGSFAAPVQTALIRTYNPVRFVFNRKTRTYDGRFTLINVGEGAQAGPLYVLFTKMPKGTTLKNATGTTKSGMPFLKLTSSIAAGGAMRFVVKIGNPLHKPFNTFYITQNWKFSATDPSGT